MTANLHVALSMAVDCQPSASDAQLIDRVYGMRAELARLRDELAADRPVQLRLGSHPWEQASLWTIEKVSGSNPSQKAASSRDSGETFVQLDLLAGAS